MSAYKARREEAVDTRLEARIKMGYYPTPLPVVERVRSFLAFPEERVNVLDPCCGEGLAVKRLVEGTNAATYGVETDEYRAKQAKEALGHVLRCGYEDARISNGAFGCLFLNPPYDWEEAGESTVHRSERKEKAFLKGTVKYVQPDGTLVYVVPQKAVTSDVANILSYRFEDFNAYRFQGKEYKPFGQIVVFGRKKREPTPSGDDFERLSAIPQEKLDEIPVLESPVYELPPGQEVTLFRSSLVDEAELEKELRASSLWGKLKGYGSRENGLGRPPLPLHSGHLGLLLASGCLDGVVGEGEDRHIVRGKVEKSSYTEQEYQGEVLVEREIETYRVSIKVLKKDGEILTLM